LYFNILHFTLEIGSGARVLGKGGGTLGEEGTPGKKQSPGQEGTPGEEGPGEEGPEERCGEKKFGKEEKRAGHIGAKEKIS